MAAGVNELRRFANKSLYSAATLNELSGKLASDPLSVPDPNKSPQSDRVADYADQLQQDGGDRFQFHLRAELQQRRALAICLPQISRRC